MIYFENNQPLLLSEILKLEQQYDDLQEIREVNPQPINLDNITSRKIEEFRDKTYNFPQHIFTIEQKDKLFLLVGRKTISRLYKEGKIKALHCSQIKACMLFGVLHELRQSGEDILVRYFPLTDGEKLNIFEAIKADRMANIDYPFKYRKHNTGEEKICAPTGWTLNPEKITYLGYGEERIRAYTKLRMKSLIKENNVVYDPACSTGEFLYSIKKEFPFCRTIGQDLSREMTDYAKNFVDEIITGDAFESPLADNYIDVMFLRFLNSEIVTSRRALEIFNKLQNKVKPGGFTVLLGHTALLISKTYLQNIKKSNLIQCNGYNPDNESIFQYYILQKSN